MGMDEVLKSVLGEQVYSEKGSTLKKELAKEVIPKSEFNAKLDKIKALEAEKGEIAAKLEEKETASMSELQKLQKNFQLLEQSLQSEKKAREDSESMLNEEKKVNSLRNKLSEKKLKTKYFDLVVPKFKNIPDEEFEDQLTKFIETNKELFGEDKLVGADPRGVGIEEPLPPEMPKSFSEWKKQQIQN